MVAAGSHLVSGIQLLVRASANAGSGPSAGDSHRRAVKRMSAVEVSETHGTATLLQLFIRSPVLVMPGAAL